VARFRIVAEESRVWVDTSTNLHPIHGEADGLRGEIEAALGAGGLDLSVPPRARIEFEIERLRSGNPLYDSELRRRLDVRRYPTIVGEVTEVRAGDSPGRYRVAGELTFHGVTCPVEGEVDLRAEDRTIEIEGERAFDVRDFGVTPPRLLMLKVEPEVRVRVRIVARREP
jgi:polyisoprenoid-binding protein YceI